MKMKKIITILVLNFLLITSNCLAIQLSQTQEIGKVFGPEHTGGFEIKGADYNNGNKITSGRIKSEDIFGRGIARFGSGGDALYVHYNAYTDKSYISEDYTQNSCRFGGKDFSNTIANAIDYCTISRISTDGDITFYLLLNGGGVAEYADYILIGRRSDGKFVKYFNTYDVRTAYLGKEGSRNSLLKKKYTVGDTLVIEYEYTPDYSNINSKKYGEFRFKWDDEAQWFGVEQVVY